MKHPLLQRLRPKMPTYQLLAFWVMVGVAELAAVAELLCEELMDRGLPPECLLLILVVQFAAVGVVSYLYTKLFPDA